jgi:hypothetical protein
VDGHVARFRDPGSPHEHVVHEHADRTEYGEGWAGLGRLIPLEDGTCLRSPLESLRRVLPAGSVRDAEHALREAAEELIKLETEDRATGGDVPPALQGLVRADPLASLVPDRSHGSRPVRTLRSLPAPRNGARPWS